MTRIATLIALLLLMLSALGVTGQPLQGIAIDLSAIPADASGTGITEIVARITNNGKSSYQGTLEIAAPEHYRLLTRGQSDVSIIAGASTYVPVKLYAPGNVPAGDHYQLKVVLQDKQGRHSANAQLALTVKKIVNTSITLLQDEQLISNEQQLSVPVHIVNTGNTRQLITIIVKYPPGFRQKGQFFTKVPVDAFRDTTLYYTTKISPEMRRKGAFDLKFTGLYSDGNLISISTARVAVAKTVHAFHRPAPANAGYDGTPNSLTVMARYINDPLENYEIWGGSSIAFGKSRVIYNIDAVMWKQQNIKPVLRNTNVAYEYGNTGIVAGSINRNLDINLYGKGVAAYIKKAGRHSLEAGYLQDGYNLLMPQEVLSLQKGWSAWLHHEYTGKQIYLKTDIITNTPSFVRVKNQLITSELGWADKHSNRLQLNAGFGRTTSTENDATGRNGIAGGIIYNFHYRQIRLISNNYASSGYYPGYRRGAITLAERAEWQYSSKYKLWLSGTYYSFDPKILPGTVHNFAPAQAYYSGRSDIGWEANPGGKFSCTVSANYCKEGSSFNNVAQPGSLVSIRSAHLAATLNFSNSLRHYFATASFEGGGYNTSTAAELQPHLKANIAAGYRNFRLTAFYQSGYFQASEVLSYNNVAGIYRQYTINPQFARGFFRDRLKVEAGYAYNSSSRFASTSLLTCSVRYNISPRLAALASYSGFSYNGVRQHIAEAGFSLAMPPVYTDALRGGRGLRVFAFHDRNGNGVYDEGDDAAVGQVLMMNNTPFITNSEGIARYTHLPDTTVRIRIADGQEWYAADHIVKPGDTATLALQKTAMVTGRITYVADEYGYDIEQKLNGIVLSLAGKDKTYKARTDDKGSFAFYIPAGTYELVLDAGTLSDKVESPQQGQIVHASTLNTVVLPVKLQLKGRKINIKKFGSHNSK